MITSAERRACRKASESECVAMRMKTFESEWMHEKTFESERVVICVKAFESERVVIRSRQFWLYMQLTETIRMTTLLSEYEYQWMQRYYTYPRTITKSASGSSSSSSNSTSVAPLVARTRGLVTLLVLKKYVRALMMILFHWSSLSVRNVRAKTLLREIGQNPLIHRDHRWSWWNQMDLDFSLNDHHEWSL